MFLAAYNLKTRTIISSPGSAWLLSESTLAYPSNLSGNRYKKTFYINPAGCLMILSASHPISLPAARSIRVFKDDSEGAFTRKHVLHPDLCPGAAGRGSEQRLDHACNSHSSLTPAEKTAPFHASLTSSEPLPASTVAPKTAWLPPWVA